jgi:hypothetical protein
MADCREKVRSRTPGKKPGNWMAAAFIVMIRLLAIYLCFKFLRRMIKVQLANVLSPERAQQIVGIFLADCF